MTIQRPTNLPRWADSPPVPPPSTITEPSEPEKDAGFQPGSAAQVDDFFIANVLNTHTYNATVNGIAGNFTSDGTATLAEVLAGLSANLALNLIGQPLTVTTTGTAVRVTANVAGQAFVSTTTDGANVTINHITANKTGKPIRQYINWLFNLVYQWIVFWYYAAFGWGDVAAMGCDVPAAGTPPGTGVILTGTSGSAVAYVPTGSGNEVRRAVGLTEAHTYLASKDTYVSLSYDGSWIYQPVANGGLAPAIASTARLQWVVVTDGTGITSVVDRRLDVANFNRPLFFGKAVSFGDAADETFTQLSSAKYTRILNTVRGASSTTPSTVRVYLADQSSFVADGGLVIAIGCQWIQGTGWRFDAATLTTNPSKAAIYYFDRQGKFGMLTKDVAGAISTTTWDDTGIGGSGWDVPSQTFGIQSILLGLDLNGSEDDSQWARLQAILAGSGTTPRMKLFSCNTGAGTLAIYLANSGASGGFSMGPCFEFVQNGQWDSGAHKWVRDSAGRMSKMEFGSAGMRLLTSTNTPIVDTVNNAGDWSLAYSNEFASGKVKADGYEVRGTVDRNPAGSFTTTGTGFTCSVISNSQSRVTLTRAMPTTPYFIQITPMRGDTTGVMSNSPQADIHDDSSFDVSFQAAGTNVRDDLTSANEKFAFVAKPLL